MTMTFGAASATKAAQGDLIDCGNDKFEFADSLRQLPGEIRRESGERMRIADLGEPYDGGRVSTGLPGDRFAGAAIGHDHVFVVIEGNRTGVVYSDALWVFERRGAKWVGRSKYGGGRNLHDILALSCRQYSPHRHAATMAGVRLDCDVNFMTELVMLRYDAPAGHGDFELRSSGRHQFDVEGQPILDVATQRPASADARAQLRRTLELVSAAMPPDDGCGFPVSVFLMALRAHP